jgi:DNA-directed RNA polymerase sigma subunit (sigma70/sigma32)
MTTAYYTNEMDVKKEAVRKLEEKALDKLFCSKRIKELA